MASEIIEEGEEEEDQSPYFNQAKEVEKIKIRRIIDYQKSLYFSSSSSSSCSSSSSSLVASTSSSKRSSLLNLMREGSTSLRRLFDMEHTSLANYFNDYSVSSIVKPIPLWGSDTDDDGVVRDDPWAEMARVRGGYGLRVGEQEDMAVSSRSSCNNEEIVQRRKLEKTRKKKLVRTRSYKRLPGFSLWRCGRFKFKLRLIRRLRVMIRRAVF